MHDPAARWLPVLRMIAVPLFWILGPIRSIGKYRVPKEGGVLILANHLADVDPIVVQAACPRRIFFMAKHELFEMKILGSFMRWYQAFPIHQGEPDRKALRHAISLLRQGHVVCLFPEGKLSESGDMLPILPGAALIIRQSGAPAICLGIQNTNRIMPYGKFIPRPCFRSVPARWGEPHTFEKTSSTEEIVGWIEGQLRELTDQVKD